MLLENSLYAGILIAAVILLRPLLRRAPARLLVYLWGAALLRLLVPMRLSSPLSLYNWLPGLRAGGAALLSEDVAITVNSGNAAQGVLQSVTYCAKGTALNWGVKFPALWAAGVLLCAGVLFILTLRTRRALCIALPLAARAPLKQICPGVRLYTCEGIVTPLNCGVLRPRILLPSDMPEGEPELLYYALAHEMGHIRGRHNLLKAVGLVALCLHWFNPMVYILLIFLGRDLERACDESVLRQLGRARRADYAKSLLRFAGDGSKWRPLCSAFGGNPVEERVRGIMGFGKCTPARTVRYSAFCFLLCALLISSPVLGNSAADAAAEEGLYITQSAEEAENGAHFVMEWIDTGNPLEQITDVQVSAPVEYEVKFAGEGSPLSALPAFLGMGVISISKSEELAGEATASESVETTRLQAEMPAQAGMDESIEAIAVESAEFER